MKCPILFCMGHFYVRIIRVIFAALVMRPYHRQSKQLIKKNKK